MASTIKVDNVQNQPGTNIINKCSVTTTIGAGAGETINVCGATVNIGRCGGTVALAAGATQTGFGRTGAVNWDTASIKTATFTAVSGSGYFCNTTAGIFNITMPASPSAGDIVGLKDYAGTFATNNLTIDRNGSKLDGESSNRALDTNYTSLTLVYVDGIQGWIPTEEGTGFVGVAPLYVTATGGSPCTGAICGDYKIHSFTGPGTLTVSCAGNPNGSTTVDYLVVAGGGAGGRGATDSGNAGGGGGAGGYRESVPSPAAWTGSPLASPGGSIPVAATPYPITVGGGGTKAPFPAPANTCSPSAAGDGFNSSFSTIISTSGGGAANRSSPTPQTGAPGGSGGGGVGSNPGGTGDTPSTPIAQGTDGGSAVGNAGGGGGGATVAGSPSPNGCTAGVGGTGATTCISASPTAYAGGGGSGGSSNSSGAAGGAGGTGGGGTGATEDTSNAQAGTVNTGGGGGGGGGSDPGTSGANGGSGIVIIRYKFQ